MPDEAKQYKVEHEFDDEPTYVVCIQDQTTAAIFPPETDDEGGLPWELRLKAARHLAEWLSQPEAAR